MVRKSAAIMWRVAYCLIAEQHIHVGHNLHEVVLEELADERRREVQAKQFVVFGRMLCHFQYGLQRDCQEETLDGRMTPDFDVIKRISEEASNGTSQHTMV